MRHSRWLFVLMLVTGGVAGCSDTDGGTVDEVPPKPATVLPTTEATEEGSVPAADHATDATLVDDGGIRYGIVFSSIGPDPQESVGGCIPAAGPGQTNIRFGLLVGPSPTSAEDRRSVAIPHMEFRLNLTADGRAVDTTATTFDSARYTNVEVEVEARPDGQCDDMNSIGPGRVPSADSIAVETPLAFPLKAGPTADPPPQGMVLYVRFFPSSDGDVTDIAFRYDP